MSDPSDDVGPVSSDLINMYVVVKGLGMGSGVIGGMVLRETIEEIKAFEILKFYVSIFILRT